MTIGINRFQSLDSLRGIAAIVIAVYHFLPTWGGYLALDFFFVLSGFVLSHRYLHREQATTVLNFTGRRLARLYPYHIVTLVAFIAVQLVLGRGLPTYQEGTLTSLLQQLTLTHNVGLNPNGLTWNYPSWSISVEFWVNIAFIWLVSKTTRSTILFFVALAGLILIYANTGHLETQAVNYYGFLNSGMVRGLSGFLLGVLTYRIYLRWRDNRRWRLVKSYVEVAVVVAVAIIVVARNGKFSDLDVLAPFVFMVLVASYADESGAVSSRLRKLNYLGSISYSVYLNQIIVKTLIWHGIPSLRGSFFIRLVVFLTLLLIVSHFTYRFVEQPLRKLGRKVFPI